MSKLNYLVLDVETGGTNPGEDSLLEVGMLAVFNDGRRARAFQAYHQEEQYRVTAGAMGVNKLDLVKVYEQGKVSDTLVYDMIKFVESAFPEGKNSFVLMGHNMAMDKYFIKTLFESVGCDMDEHFNYRFIDTAALILAAKDMGIVPQEVSGGLQNFAAHYNLPTGNAHSAVDDCWTTLYAYEYLTKLITGGNA